MVKKIIFMFVICIVMINLVSLISSQELNLENQTKLNASEEALDVVAYVSGSDPFITPPELEIKEDKEYRLRFLLGYSPKDLYNLSLALLILGILFFSLLLIQQRFNYSIKIKIILSIILTPTIANLGLIKLIVDFLVSVVVSPIGKILTIIFLVITILIEIFFSLIKKSHKNIQVYNY